MIGIGDFATLRRMSPRPRDPATHEAVKLRLKQLRAALALSQVTIAKLAHMTPQAWWNCEAGPERISVDSAIQLSIATGVTLDWIFRGELRGVPIELATKLQAVVLDEPQPAPKRKQARR